MNSPKIKWLSKYLFLPILIMIITINCSDQKPTENDEKILSFKKSTQVFNPTRTYQIALTDLDDDGDLDAVCSNMGENNSVVWLGDGDGFFTASGQMLTMWGHGVGIGDLDGDTDLDLVITCASDTYRSRIYLNDGNASFSDNGQVLPDSNLSGNGVSLFDIDTDGDLDAAIIYYEHADIIYLNDGTGLFTESNIILPEHSTFADIDTDGDVDIFVKEHGTGYKTMLNDGQGNFTDYWQMDDTRVTYGTVSLDDLDRDNDVDAFICNGDNTGNNYPTIILLNDGSGRFSDSGQELGESSWGRVGLGDLDGDSSIDAFVSNFGWPNEVWINDGTGQFHDSGLRFSGDVNDNTTFVALGDVDNDGDLDAFAANFVDGRNEIWLNNSN